jgi:hypothetical protein
MLLKKMTLVQAHIRGKRTNRGGWDSASTAACISIYCECSAARWRYRPRSKWGRHRVRLPPPRKAKWRQWGLYRRAPALAAPAAILSRAILTKAAVVNAGSRTMSPISPPSSRRWGRGVAAVVAGGEGTIVAMMLEPGATALHTHQMIKILRAAQELFLETSGGICTPPILQSACKMNLPPIFRAMLLASSGPNTVKISTSTKILVCACLQMFLWAVQSPNDRLERGYLPVNQLIIACTHTLRASRANPCGLEP